MWAQSKTHFVASVLGVVLVVASCTSKGVNPAGSVAETDLAGIWTANYGDGLSDRLELQANGLYRQEYAEANGDYRFDSGWRTWSLDTDEDGITRVHLDGARYFLEGTERAEADGLIDPKNPCLTPTDCDWGLRPFPFYDPFSGELMHMVGELVLIVRADSRGQLILHHVWTSADGGFPIIGGDREVFKRIARQ
jgi:hypothetical protein